MVLGAGFVLTIAILTYALLLEPWYRELVRLRGEVPKKEADLQWMNGHVDVATRLRTKKQEKGSLTSTSLLSLVEKTADAAKVPIRQINPGNDGEVKIWFKETDFDPWLVWLESLRKHGVEATSVSIDRTGTDKVSIRLTVRGGG